MGGSVAAYNVSSWDTKAMHHCDLFNRFMLTQQRLQCRPSPTHSLPKVQKVT